MRNTLTRLRSCLALAHPGRVAPPEALIAGGPPPLGADGHPDPGAEAGMATAEYAIGTLAAAAFAGLLLAIIRSGSISGLLENIIGSALSVS